MCKVVIYSRANSGINQVCQNVFTVDSPLNLFDT
jgi:hypothetical protein